MTKDEDVLNCPLCGNKLSKPRNNGVVPCDNFCHLRHSELTQREWNAIAAKIDAARLEGFEMAREKAAALFDGIGKASPLHQGVARRIRAMQMDGE